MSDICTLVIVTNLATQGCFTPIVCYGINAEGLQICTPGYAIACPPPPQIYECKDAANRTYYLTQEQVDEHNKGAAHE